MDWRSTAAEHRMALPCDEELPQCDDILHRAVDIDAPAATVFRWLCQMKIAPYSYDLLDNLGRQSPRALMEGADKLHPGDTIMTIFTLRSFEQERLMTIRMTHPAALHIFGDIAISYLITQRSEGGSRLFERMRLVYPWRLPFRAMCYVLPFGDWFMAQKQLRTFRRLAERDARRPSQIKGRSHARTD